MAALLPKLRPIEVHPFSEGGQPLYLIRDPLEFANAPLAVDDAGMIVLSCLDGDHTIVDAQERCARSLGGRLVFGAEIEAVIAELGERYYLDDERAAERIATVVADFRSSQTRAAWHAGTAYPSELREVRAALDGFARAWDSERAESVEPLAAGGLPLVGVLAPHIDLRVGGPTYVPAFREVAASGADLFIILGVAHAGGERFFTATRKDYAVPGRVIPTDTEFLHDWTTLAGRDMAADDWIHRTEHSAEFPLIFLDHFLKRPYQVVPVLLGSTLPGHLERGLSSEPSLADELGALGECLRARRDRIAVILSVDLSHVGPQFGGAAVDDAAAADTSRADRLLLQAVADGDSHGFKRQMSADANARNVDAVSGLLVAFELFGAGLRGDILAYDQHRQPDTESLVSYASMALYLADQ